MGNLRSRTIYVIGVSKNPVKIGLAAKLKDRLISLQIGCPDPLIVYHTVRVPDHLAKPIESAAHQHFAPHHRQGEWFNIEADEAITHVKRLSEEFCGANGVHVRRHGDVLDQLAANYPLDASARSSIRHYLDRLGTPFGKKEIARWDAVLLKRCGAAALTLFRKIIVDGETLYGLMTLHLRLSPAAKDRAEASLAKAVNTLAEYMAWEREEAFLVAISGRRAIMYPESIYPSRITSV